MPTRGARFPQYGTSRPLFQSRTHVPLPLGKSLGDPRQSSFMSSIRIFWFDWSIGLLATPEKRVIAQSSMIREFPSILSASDDESQSLVLIVSSAAISIKICSFLPTSSHV